MTCNMRGYSNRVWLNPDGHPSTGAVVAYHGASPWNDGGLDTVTMLEISDCRYKVRLHRGENDSLEEFITKLEVLRDVIGDFVTHLHAVKGPLK